MKCRSLSSTVCPIVATIAVTTSAYVIMHASAKILVLPQLGQQAPNGALIAGTSVLSASLLYQAHRLAPHVQATPPTTNAEVEQPDQEVVTCQTTAEQDNDQSRLRFFRACQSGDIAAIQALLDEGHTPGRYARWIENAGVVEAVVSHPNIQAKQLRIGEGSAAVYGYTSRSL